MGLFAAAILPMVIPPEPIEDGFRGYVQYTSLKSHGAVKGIIQMDLI